MVYISDIRRGVIRTLAAILMICLVTGLMAGCGNKYKPVPSTGEELRIVMTINGFDVPYELYRYFYLGYKSEFEKGDPTIWDKPEGSALEAKLNESVISALKGVYASLSLCRDHGISMNDTAVQEYVDQYVIDTIDEYGGRDKYLKALASKNMNDSSFRFFMGVDKCESELYNVLTTGLGIIPDDKDSVMAYLNSDKVIRVVQVLIQNDEDDSIDANRALAEEVQSKAKSGVDFNTLIKDYSEDFLMRTDGYYLNHLDMIEEFENAAYKLAVNEVSGVVETHIGFHIIKRLPKEPSYITENYEDLKLAYLNSAFYTIIEEKREGLSYSTTEFYKTLNIKTVK